MCEVEIITGELLYQIKRCEEYYQAWEVIVRAFEKQNSAICIAKDFFVVVANSLKDSMMAELIKLYDNNRDVVSVRKCLYKCCNTKEIKTQLCSTEEKSVQFDRAVSRFDNYLDDPQTEKLIAALRKRRNKYYMHNDSKTFYDPTYLVKDYPLTFDDINQLIENAKEFCNAAYTISTGKIWTVGMHKGRGLEFNRDFSGLEKLLMQCTDTNFE